MSDLRDLYERFGRGRFPFFESPSFRDIFQDFEEFEREVEMFKDLERHAPKELVRERKLPSGATSKEFGPFIYGYSITLGPDGKQEIREFGNVKPSKGRIPMEFAETREPLVDIIDEGDTLKVVAEMAGVNKNDINVEVTEKTLTISSEVPRKYHKELELEMEVQPDSAKATYNNGILEVKLTKSQPSRAKGKQVKVE